MPRILLTAFEPYDQWTENSSWLTLVELTRWRDFGGQVVTRRYPVDLTRMMDRLQADLAANYDFALHLGQAPGAVGIKLEAMGINLDTRGHRLRSDGPEAYRSSLPLNAWSMALQTRNIPATVSYHAGTYLCNALLYLSQHLVTLEGYQTKVAFVHLPLITSQVCDDDSPTLASMSLPMLAAGINTLIDLILEGDTAQAIA